MPTCSIIIRSKNEEKWIGHCLKMVHLQEMKDFEVILVDNQSSDGTVLAAQRIGVDKVVSIDRYLPGDAINKGVQVASGEYIICLSAHCIPTTVHWLSHLVAGFSDLNIAGVYGRQIPLPFSDDWDKRDLLITFGRDQRRQIKDYFFHNANSAVRRDILETIPFDGTVTNIEDRLWAKAVIENGYEILYEPEAVVYHHHGIHHGRSEGRLKSTVTILESSDLKENGIPHIMQPENLTIAAVCPVAKAFCPEWMDQLIDDLKRCGFVSCIFLLSELDCVAQYCDRHDLQLIRRPPKLMPPDGTLEEVLQFALNAIEKQGTFPELIVYANYLFESRPEGLFEGLINDIQHNGFDTVFPAVSDYHNYWRRTESGEFQMIGNWLPREGREPMYRAINGLGTVTRTPFIRSGKLIGDRVGLFTLRRSIEKRYVV